MFLVILWWCCFSVLRNSAALRPVLRNGNSSDGGRHPQWLLPHLSYTRQLPVRLVAKYFYRIGNDLLLLVRARTRLFNSDFKLFIYLFKAVLSLIWSEPYSLYTLKDSLCLRSLWSEWELLKYYYYIILYYFFQTRRSCTRYRCCACWKSTKRGIRTSMRTPTPLLPCWPLSFCWASSPSSRTVWASASFSPESIFSPVWRSLLKFTTWVDGDWVSQLPKFIFN